MGYHGNSNGKPPKGTNGDDLLIGSGRDDHLDGRKGDDLLFGLGGNDHLKGGKGDDQLFGGDGNDKLEGGSGDDALYGGAGNDHLKGDGGDDLLDGGDGNDRLEGGSGDDLLLGGAGNDLLTGNGGNDALFGGAGDDILYGDDKSHGHGGHSWFRWLCKPAGFDEFLDGGAGNDKVYAGGGNDFANYTMAENLGAKDFYDGGKGSDTLQLSLTYGEALLTSVQQDIDAYEAFLAARANPHKDNGPTFQFASFDLDARNFEDLTINLVNTGPTANDDAAATDEDTPVTGNVLANDTDPDHLDVLTVIDFDFASTLGADVVVNADGSYSYDPSGLLDFLAAGEIVDDSFQYTIRDLAGVTSTATVGITVTGVNDAPEAVDDEYSLDEDTVLTISGPGILGNDTDIDSATLSALLVSGPAHGTLLLNSDGSFSYTPEADFNGSDGFVYRANDGMANSAPALVSITVTEVNDAPDAVDDVATLDEDSAAIIAVLANDNAGPANEAGQTLTITGAGALHGSVVINADGTLSYTPEANYNGDDTISYTIADNGTTGGTADPRTDAATVSVTVSPVNDDPVAVDDVAATNEDAAITGNVLNGANGGLDTDVDGDTLTVTTTGAFTSTLGAAVTLNANGTFTYDPTASATLQALGTGASKLDSFAYSISDGHGGTSSATVDVTVSGLDEAGGGKGEILDSVPPGTDLDYVVRFESGEWMKLDGFSLGLQNSGSIGVGGGGGAGKGSADPAVLQLGSSAQLVALTESLLSGKHLKNVEIEAFRQDSEGKMQLVDEFKFTDVLLGNLDNGNGASNSLSLSFDSFSHGHLDYNEAGGISGNADFGWDFSLGKEASAPTPHADGTNVDADQISPADLDYYVLFEGGDGWLKLDAFTMGLQNSGSLGSGGGGGAGKSTADEVGLLLGSSSELVALTESLLSGKHLKNVEIEAYRQDSDGKMQLVDEFKFTDVLVTSLDTANASSNALNFDFRSFTHGHVEQDQDGSLGAISGTGWDFTLGKEVGAPPPQADIDFFS